MVRMRLRCSLEENEQTSVLKMNDLGCVCVCALHMPDAAIIRIKKRKTEGMVVPDDSAPCCLATELTMGCH